MATTQEAPDQGQAGGIETLMGAIDPPEQESEELETQDAPAEAEEVEAEETESEDAPAPVAEITWGVEKIALPEGTPPDVATKVQELAGKINADYTKKTMDLARQRDEIPKVIREAVEPERQSYVNGLQQAALLVKNLVIPELESVNLTQLAASDPAAYVQIQAKQNQVNQVLNAITEAMSLEQRKQADAERNETNRLMQQSWQKLTEEGIDKPKLEKIYQDFANEYGVPVEMISGNLHWQFVKGMKDAVAYRNLQKSKPQIQKKVDAAKPLQTKAPVRGEDQRRKTLMDNHRKNGNIQSLAALIGD